MYTELPDTRALAIKKSHAMAGKASAETKIVSGPHENKA
jgi:hypothetical protein